MYFSKSEFFAVWQGYIPLKKLLIIKMVQSRSNFNLSKTEKITRKKGDTSSRYDLSIMEKHKLEWLSQKKKAKSRILDLLNELEQEVQAKKVEKGILEYFESPETKTLAEFKIHFINEELKKRSFEVEYYDKKLRLIDYITKHNDKLKEMCAQPLKRLPPESDLTQCVVVN